ncbi:MULTISPECIES: hypothetical protein [Nostocales]|uniref:Uncharacterized protein n=3 Tax=Nostocales TaxID=1161 RepID=A0A8S9SXS1_9CYAN|nr:hypothetical protein [Tolypothrix bouteillei]KAF3884895.1 hypothetical protein DA73_0400005055 [Tolypothrix bouteillei VB521301]
MQVSKIYAKLNESLTKGWEDFNSSVEFNLFYEFFQFLLQAGFDESHYRKFIPNPAYDNAAKIIGKHFLATARQFEICFDEIFPGNFSMSKEDDREGVAIRVFYLTAFYQNQPLCLFVIKFSHDREKFGFPLPPELEIVKLYEV